VGLFFRVSGIVAVLLVFMGCGALVARKPAVILEPPRFERISDTTALDTKIGKVCSTVSGVQIDPQTGERVQNIPPPCLAQ